MKTINRKNIDMIKLENKPMKNIEDKREKKARLKALSEAIDCTLDEAKKCLEREDYLVLTDDEANEKAKEYILDTLWAFNANFIVSECGLDYALIDMIEIYKKEKCKSANDAISSLIEKTCGLDTFVESAISVDGRGNFLNTYDDKEIASGDYFIYRIN